MDLDRLALRPGAETVKADALPVDPVARTEPEAGRETLASFLSVRLLLLRALLMEAAISGRLETLLSRRFGEAESSLDLELLAPRVS